MFNILVIDDSKSVHAFLKALFEKFPRVKITAAYNGKDGMAKLSVDPRFDLILLDWEMPLMNGPDTLSQLRKSGFKNPLIMMTTKNAPADIAAMLKLGASEYMMKPFTPDILVEKIESVTGKAL